MKIAIRADRIRLRFRLPTSLLKSKFLIKMLLKKVDPEKTGISVKEISQIIDKSLTELKKYKGLEIVNVETNEEKSKTTVKITL